MPNRTGQFREVNPNLSLKCRAIRIENTDDCPFFRSDRVFLAELNSTLPLQPATAADLALAWPNHPTARHLHLRMHVECDWSNAANLQELVGAICRNLTPNV